MIASVAGAVVSRDAGSGARIVREYRASRAGLPPVLDA
jgi:hypothetical protein